MKVFRVLGFLCSMAAIAGGPSQRTVEGEPLTFDPDSPLVYHVETGDLGPGLPNALVRSWVQQEFAKWGNIEGGRLQIEEGPQISADVRSLPEVLGLLAMGLNPIVFDEDGSILAAAGLDPATEGIALQFGFDGEHFLQMVVVISGPANAGKSEQDLRYTLLRYLGQGLALGPSVVNGDLYFEADPEHPLGTVPVEAVEALYPHDPGAGKTLALKQGDISDFLRLYDDTEQGTAGRGAIAGTIYDADGKPTGGINVIARNRSGDEASVFFQAASTISNPLTGAYKILGLPPGEYSVEVSDVALRNRGVFGDPIKTDNPVLPGNYLNLSNARPEITGKFPGAEEFFNGELESSDPYSDAPGEFTRVSVTADATTADIDIHFNRRKESITRLLYPWISNSDGNFEAILIANNFGDQPVEVSLTATRREGETETVTRTIAAHGFLREPASTLFPALGSGAGYSVLLTGASSKLRGSWVTNSLQAASGQSPSQGVAVEIPPEEGEINERIAHRLMFGYLPINDELISAPVLVNTGAEATDIDLRFFDASGTLVAETTLENVPPWAPFAAVANQLVPEGVGEAMMVAESSGQRITGVSFVFNQVFFETAIGNATGLPPANQEEGAVTLVYPWISNNEGVFESILIANNHGNEPLSVTLTARRNGEGGSQTVTRTLPASGFLRERASQLFDELGSGPGYSVTLESPFSRVSGQWVTNNLVAASGLSPAQGVAVLKPREGAQSPVRSGNSILLGYLPLNDAFTSAPVLVNLGSEPADITLSFYRENGELVLEDRTSLTALAPGLPVATLANALLPEGSGDVYLVAESEQAPITGVVFVFNTEFFEPAIGNASAVTVEKPSKAAFVNVNLIPMDGEGVLSGMTVLVEGDAVVEIGPVDAVSVPEEALEIDGAGRYLMPGLSDAHMHVFEPGDFNLYLANGVTSGLSMGDSGYEINVWREEILHGVRHGPTLYTGNFFRGLPDEGEPNLTVATPEEARAHVIHTKALGYDFVKVYSGLSTEVFNAVMDEAQNQAMPVVGHVPREPGLENALAAGVSMIAHAEEYWSSIFQFTINPSLIPTAVSLTTEHQAHVTATLAVVEALPFYLGQNEEGFQTMLARPGVEYMDPLRLQAWRFDFLTETADPGVAGARLPFMRQYTKALFDGGAPLLLGTDATVVGMVPGFSVHEEMRAMARAGLTAFEILQSATSNFGAFINGQIPDSPAFGTIRTGGRADFLLLEANPLLDLEHLSQRVGVMARGQWYAEADLQQMLADLLESYQNR